MRWPSGKRGGDARSGGARLCWLLFASLALVACSGAEDDADEGRRAVAIAPATSVPTYLDDALALPADAEPVQFSYTQVTLISQAGRSTILGMLVADTFERRRRGLMHRTGLPPNTGMLFAFPAPTNTPFWNKNTPIDLDIAFLDGEGTIRELRTLAAFSTDLVAPETVYRYAVEMPTGWYASRGYGIGDRFVISVNVVGLAE